jgi:aminotransferase
MRIGRRMEGLAISDIRSMTRACDAVNGINLGQGVCDLPTPPPVALGAKQAIDEGRAIYTQPEGIAPLREAIAKKLEARYGLHYDARSEVVVTAGATGGFAAACMALFEPGDEVLMFEPYYGYHYNTVVAMGLRPVLVPTLPPDWRFDAAAFDRAITPRTRGVVLCTPSNPSGKVFSPEELDAIGARLEAHDLWAITDEIYEYFVYDGATHVPFATRPRARERCVLLGGFSKTFSVTGWRLGYLCAPEAAARAINVCNDLLYVCAPTPLQWAAVAGLAMPAEYYADLQRSYAGKRRVLCDALRDAGLEPYEPQGAYYVLADVRALGKRTAKEASMAILERCGVASVPGTSFFVDPVGETLARFCFAKEDSLLEEAARRLRAAKW